MIYFILLGIICLIGTVVLSGSLFVTLSDRKDVESLLSGLLLILCLVMIVLCFITAGKLSPIKTHSKPKIETIITQKSIDGKVVSDTLYVYHFEQKKDAD